MRRTSLILLLLSAATMSAADRRPGSLLMFTGDSGETGIFVHCDMVSEPPGYTIGPSGWSTEKGGTYHHYMVDWKGMAYFGYDLTSEPVPGTSKIRVRIEPLSLTAEKVNRMFAASADKPDFARLRFLVLPKYPPPQVIESGDTIALDLLASPDGKQKVVDYITFNLQSKK